MIVSKQSSTTFSDKEQIWADNASSAARSSATSTSAGRRSAATAGQRAADPADRGPVHATAASPGPRKQVGPATDNGINAQPDGCTVRTDSTGNVYVFGIGVPRAAAEFEMMYKSTDGGAHFGPAARWSRPSCRRASSTRRSVAR